MDTPALGASAIYLHVNVNVNVGENSILTGKVQLTFFNSLIYVPGSW